MFPMPRFTFALPCAALFIFAATSCGGDSPSGPDTTPAALALVAGNSQTGTVGQALGSSLTVRVANAGGTALAGVAVTWTVTGGGGSLASGSTQTGTDGQASVAWTLGTTSGTANNTATARVNALPNVVVTFTATANPGPVTQLAIVSGNNQTGEAGTALTQPLTVVARDQHNNPVPATSIQWGVTEGEGTLSATSGPTGANGQASVTWTVGTESGTNNNKATATAVGVAGSTQTFQATALVGAPNQIAILSGAGQAAEAGTLLPQTLTVAVTDRHGNAVVGHTVDWIIVSGAGTLAGGGATTNANGLSSRTWTLGTGVGEQRARATAAGLPAAPANFVATSNAGPPALLATPVGGGQTAPAGTILPTPLRVTVTDRHGNPLNGASVDWEILTGNGSVAQPSSTTGADGNATIQWTLGRFAGGQSASARLTATPTVTTTFAANATPNGTISGTVTITNQLLAAGRPTGSVVKTRSAAFSGIQPSVAPVRTSRPLSMLSSRLGRRSTSVPRQPRVAEYVPDELIVTWRTGATASAMRSRFEPAERAGRVRVTGASPMIRAARIRVTDPSSIDSIAQALRLDPGVASVERNGIAYSLHVPSVVPPPPPVQSNDPFFPFQAWHYRAIDLPDAWAITTGSASVLVAVVDDGIRFDHPDIAPNLTADGYDFVTSSTVPVCGGGFIDAAGDGDGPDSDPTIPVSYDRDPVFGCVNAPSLIAGHGLHVAGTIGAAGNNGAGVSGINWNVRIRPIRALNSAGSGTSYDIAQGILYAAGLPADNGAGGTVQAPSAAHIINLSIGGPDNLFMRNAVVAANAAGSLLIAAAGNSAVSTPSFPAAYDEVLSVSSVGPDGQLASYSNFGSTVDIAAPGGDIGDGGCFYGVVSTMWDFDANAPTYECIQGTSMASPHVAGVAALILAQSPGLSAAQLRARLVDYAKDRGAPGRDDQYGAGVVSARNSLTQTFSPPRQLYAQLYSATTGTMVRRVAAVGGSYSFGALADGAYYVFAGEDESADGRVGVPDRRWGAFGSSAAPGTITVDGSGIYPANFAIGLPIEAESNNSLDLADVLPVGGYLVGFISPVSDADFTKVVIATTGTYTFETSAGIGACGLVLDEDTILGLFNSSGGLLASNDDIDFDALNVCSRITMTLTPGTYFLRVTGYMGGIYRIEARAGS